MIRKRDKRETETRKDMRGGTGEVVIRHYFKKDEVNASCRLCAELIIAPEASIGLHEHNDEDELFIIQSGRGIIVDGGKETEIEEGDSILTGKGASHSIRNTGDVDLVVTAIIMQYH